MMDNMGGGGCNSNAKAQQGVGDDGIEIATQRPIAGGKRKKLPFSGGGFSVNGSTCPTVTRKQFQTPIPAGQRETLEPSKLPPVRSSSPNNDQPTTSAADHPSSSQQLMLRKSSSTIETVLCRPSELQKQVYNELDFLDTLKTDEQQKMKQLVCNHPILCYHRFTELSAGLNHSRSSKKAKKEFADYSIVTRHFPIRFERSQCRIEDSGKLMKLFEMVTANSEVAKLIIASNYVKTLDLLEELFSNLTLQFALYRINANMPATALQLFLERIVEPEPEEKCKLILLNTKTERLAGTTLFDAARLIFYDFDSIRDESVLDEWEAGEKFDQIYMLITDDTFEAKEWANMADRDDED